VVEVVISGRGIVSSLGVGIDANWQAACAGRSGITENHPLSQLHGRPIPLGHVRGFGERDTLHDLSSTALDECIESARLSPQALQPAALIYAQSVPNYDVLEREAQRIADTGQCRPDTVYRTMISYVGAKLARRHKLQGPVVATSAACSGSALSLHLGLAMIRSGAVDRCLCGGGEIISRWAYGTFDSMKAVLAPPAPGGDHQHPFGAERAGIVLGEGAGFLLLERADAARDRGAPVYGRLLQSAHGNVPEATWGDVPDPLIWQQILQRCTGAIRPDYIVGHGTSTLHGDRVEGQAIQSLHPGVPVASLKPFFGHTLAASTVLDSVLLLSCFEHQTLLGVGLDYERDPTLADLHLLHAPRSQPLSRALKLTAGFGGSISCLLFASP
jgi:3-oxoacyl-[acyl-carrier-protein] synthase II